MSVSTCSTGKRRQSTDEDPAEPAAAVVAATSLAGSTGVSRRSRDWSRVALSPLLVLIIVLIDRFVATNEPSLGLHGVLDEIGHVATTGVLLGFAVGMLPTRCRPRATVIAVTIMSSVLIDVDHLPALFGWEGLTAGTPRPYPHSIATIFVLSIAVLGVPRRARPFAAAALAGVMSHLLRDVGTAPVALLWPVSWSGVELAHSRYLALLVMLAATNAGFALRRRPVVDLRDTAPQDQPGSPLAATPSAPPRRSQAGARYVPETAGSR